MSETEDSGGLNLLRVDPDRAGEQVRVTTSSQGVTGPREMDGYVDDDGIVRQEGNGAAFNGSVYEVKR